MELAVGRQQTRKEFWLEHIKAAEAFEGTIKEYCRLHNLKMGSMSSYRTKLGFSKPLRRLKKKKKSNFVPIKVSSSPAKLKAPSSLPDPKWLAQFLKAWSDQ